MSRRIPRLPVTDRESYLVQRSPPSTRVLHVGCTCWPATRKEIENGKLLHAQLSQRCNVTGIDISEAGLQELRRSGYGNVLYWDALNLEAFPQRDFDVVVASDVIEHVANPGALLQGVRSVLRPGGKLLLSTVNAFSLETYMKLILNWESVHPEHVSYYSYATIAELVSRYGFGISDAAYYYSVGWRGPFNSRPHRVSYTLMRFATKLVPHYATGLLFELELRAAA